MSYNILVTTIVSKGNGFNDNSAAVHSSSVVVSCENPKEAEKAIENIHSVTYQHSFERSQGTVVSVRAVKLF